MGKSRWRAVWFRAVAAGCGLLLAHALPAYPTPYRLGAGELLRSSTGLFIRSAEAQSTSARGKGVKSSLSGIPIAEVERRFGRPDEIHRDPTGRDVWRYGASSIFFGEGKVTAWVDQGDLAKRENSTAIKSEAPKQRDDLADEWVNPWTPKPKAEAKKE